MKNPRVTKREWGLIKGALRRVFSRSELRNSVITDSIDHKHKDASRLRVKTWCTCTVCGSKDAKSNMAVDHLIPVIPVNSSFEEMSLDELVDRLWCEKNNLQTICDSCHTKKTKQEAKERSLNKKRKKK